ncbi:MAG: ATP-binding cassette domain-containing protein [Oscillospiraceae bacterium]
MSNEYLLEVNQLKTYFNNGHGLGKNKKALKAVDGISFKLKHGETLGIVGESGCGKSTAGNTIIRLLEPTEGEIIFEGRDIAKLSDKELRPLRKDIQMIFQDPVSSLNPRMRVKNIIAEPLVTHKICKKAELEEEVFRLMDVVGLPREYADRYPHEFSGGQRQRIGIARALALKPKLIICDEPVSALDVSIQAQILNLLAKLQKDFGLAYIFIAHGLPTVKHISNRVAVMYLGKIVEMATKEQIFSSPMHPYSVGLMSAVPIPDPIYRNDDDKALLEGDMPSPTNLPEGCRFHPRCKFCRELCKSEAPELRDMGEGHMVACHFPLENAEGLFK